ERWLVRRGRRARDRGVATTPVVLRRGSDRLPHRPSHRGARCQRSAGSAVIHPRERATWARAKEAFWDVVVDCLVEIHMIPQGRAGELAAELRKSIEAAPAGIMGDLLYHSEPFDVACDLAQRQLDFREYASQYSAI